MPNRPSRRPVLHRATAARSAAVLLAVAAALGTAVPAVAAVAPQPGPSVAQSGADAEAARDAESERLGQLNAEVRQRGEAVDAARTELDAAATAAGEALERYSVATRALQSAQATENQARDRLARAQARLAAERQNLGRWARTAYQGGTLGGGLTGGIGVASVLEARSTDDLAVTSTVLRQIGRHRSRTVDAVERAEAQVAAAAAAAGDAAQVAADAAVEAAAARERADAAVDVQRRELDARTDELTRAETDAAASARRRQALAAASAIAADNRVTGAVGSCTGGAGVEQYPNGQIPLAALCPLATAPGHYLRADAALAFDRLSNAYAARFGTPICVTDSYRPLADQIRLRLQKPTLAAVPGTSNHGWGTATDLCGGIQNFGTAEHTWMLVNAPLQGWFHPSWAQATGSKPEPWHWEYGG